MTTPGPYAAGADAYWRAGWKSPVPLPYKAKKNPPTGYTGAGGIDPSYPDIDTWVNGPEGGGNIALRMPRNVIGIDVDAYGDKLGRQTLAEAEAAHGELPATWRTTSRDDGISGIRFYRVPEGLAWPGEIGHSTEIIQHRHRYALVWPSVHPEGRTYRWIGPEGVTAATVPDVDDLPLLPDAWVTAYTGGELAQNVNRGNAPAMAVAGWLTSLGNASDALCSRMEAAVDQMRTDTKGSAHNAARDAALRAIRLADEGHHGLMPALEEMRAIFVKDATSPDRRILGKSQRTDPEASREWADIVTSAGNLVQANPTGVITCDCDGDLTALITGGTGVVDGALALAPPEPKQVQDAETTPEPGEAPTRLKDGAKFILDAPEQVPAVWGAGDEVLWSTGEALMIVGPPGVGKTTITGQLVRGLLGLEQSVLGMHVKPSEGRVLYLAMDRPAQIARALRRGFHESERAVLADNLRVWEGPPPGDVAKHTDLLVTLAHLAGATTVIVDSLKDAAVGLTEDEIGAGYNRARQTALANGIQVLELHHLVKRGPNGSKPNTLADVYGSAWLTAGAGSVLLLWGAAGDPLVEAVHLKQPAAEVGPLRVLHDHQLGHSSIIGGGSLLEIIAATGVVGMAAKDVARALYQTDDPGKNEVEKARGKLKRLVDAGEIQVISAQGVDRWRIASPLDALDANVSSNVANVASYPQGYPQGHVGGVGDDVGALTSTNTPNVGGVGAALEGHSQNANAVPPFKGGRPAVPANFRTNRRTVTRTVAGRLEHVDLATGEVIA
jgi:DNA polymerase III delta prime subunit